MMFMGEGCIVKSLQASIIKYHKFSELDNRNLCSQSSDNRVQSQGWKEREIWESERIRSTLVAFT